MVVYPPYVVPCALVVAGWGIGHLLLPEGSPGSGSSASPLSSAPRSWLPEWWAPSCLPAGDVVQALRGTDYPGERVEASGGFAVERLLYGPFTPNLRRAEASAPGTLDPLGGNQSEASTFVLLGLLVVLLRPQSRRGRRDDGGAGGRPRRRRSRRAVRRRADDGRRGGPGRLLRLRVLRRAPCTAGSST